jgi:hypothetical protein
MTVIVFDFGDCGAVKLNPKASEFAGKRVLREYWPTIATPLGDPLTNNVLVLTRKLPNHEEKTTPRLMGKCSKLERWAEGLIAQQEALQLIWERKSNLR